MPTTWRTKVNYPLGRGALNAGIDSDDLSIVLQSGQGANFPASGAFTIVIDEEIILIDSRSTDTLTVNASGRGWGGSTAAGHDAGAGVYQYQIKEDFTDLETAVNALEALIAGSGVTGTLLNSTYTTVNAFGAATTLNMGAGASATANLNFTTAINLNTDAVKSSKTTLAVFNETCTTVNAFGAATTINMGATGGATYTTKIHGLHVGNVFGQAGFLGLRYDGLAVGAYAIMQGSNGATYLNSATGTAISVRVNNTEQLKIESNGMTFAEAKNVIVGTTTGTKIGTGTTQKLGFWNVTPVVQPAAAGQAALTNSTGGTGDGTLSACGDTSTGDQSGVINNNFTEVFTLLDAMRTALVNTGLMKGAA